MASRICAVLVSVIAGAFVIVATYFFGYGLKNVLDNVFTFLLLPAIVACITLLSLKLASKGMAKVSDFIIVPVMSWIGALLLAIIVIMTIEAFSRTRFEMSAGWQNLVSLPADVFTIMTGPFMIIYLLIFLTVSTAIGLAYAKYFKKAL